MNRRLAVGGVGIGCLCLSMVVFAAQEAPANGPQPNVLRSGEHITRIYGQALAEGASAVEAAEQFRTQRAAMFGVSPDDLRPESLLIDRRPTQPVMFDRQTGAYKFTLVYYSQYKNGVPVFNADLRLLVRNEPGWPVVLAASSLRHLGEFSPSAQPTPAENPTLGREQALAFAPALVSFTEPKRVVWAGADDRVVQPVVAYTFVGDNQAPPNAAARERWLFVADAITGEILHKEDQVLEVDVTGNVSGMASQGVGADICELEMLEVMPFARANIGATNAFADESGDFTIPNGGTTAVTVQSPVRGQYFHVFNFAGAGTVLSQSVVPPGPANFTHNQANTSELVRAEVNGYVEANVVRQAILSANPSYPVISTDTEFPVNVNQTGGICPGNAQYTFDAINFCRAGSIYPNTAWSSVVHHEYGHHLVQSGGSGQGAYGEGMGDVMSVIILDDPRLGFGFFGNCTESLRTADNNCQYSAGSCSTCGSEIHACGQLLSGCVWDTREELVLTAPDDYQQILLDLAVNAVLMHSGSGIGFDIPVDWLTLDDDDNNIDNGTPHRNEICTGFGAHGLNCPLLAAISFEYPIGRPQFVTPGQPTVIPVNVVGVADEPVSGTGTLRYRIGTSGAFTTVPMVEVAPNQYEATLPAADCTETIQYYFQATAQVAGSITDPANAPASTFSAISASGTTTIFEDTFETNQGWTVTGNAVTGDWNRGLPLGGGDRGDPPTDTDDSGGQCYLTDNADGDTDVDNGSTTLTSPVMDASDPGSVISYNRWYSNTFGAAPMQDTFLVQISSNGGANWSPLETVGPSGPEADGGWFYKEFKLADIAGFVLTNQFRIRFTASDTDPQSVVEAGVDAVRLFMLNCPPPCAADLDEDGTIGPADLALLLGAWGPTEGHPPEDINEDGNVGPMDLALLLGAWGDCG